MFFFPGLTTITDAAIKARLVECELDDILGDLTGSDRIEQTINSNHAAEGSPDGSAGLVISARPQPPGVIPNTGYYKDAQEWVHIGPKNYWIGLQIGAKPRPCDLQRNGHLLQDYQIKLADGNEWSIMTMRPLERPGSIPRVGRMGENCEWSWNPHPRFDALLQKYDQIFAGHKDTTNHWADLAIETLAVNYRINRFLAMLLGVLELEHCSRIIDLASDIPEFEAHEEAKKRGIERSDISVTSYGEVIPPASPITAQHTAISTGSEKKKSE